MSCLAYTGVFGSGKTYEAVSTGALTALRSGRRVVTNILGFNHEAIRDFLGPLPDGSLLEPDKVVVIPTSRVTQPDFFYDPDRQVESVIRPGDLVLLDEVWSFWGDTCKISPEHMKFFRMHRHYTEAGTGTSCDLLIMIQDLASLHRSIRNVLEGNLRFVKLKTLGLSSAYRVEVYEGKSQTKKSLVSSTIKRYDKKIFPLYKSYDGPGGKEAIVDDRQNLLKNKWFIALILFCLVGMIFGGTWFYRYIANLRSGGSNNLKPVSSSAQPSGASLNSASTNPQDSPLQASPSLVSSDSRLAGLVTLPSGETLLLVQLADGRYVRQRMSSGELDGWRTSAGFQGRFVQFTGTSTSSKPK